jgi:hypothetical protein
MQYATVFRTDIQCHDGLVVGAFVPDLDNLIQLSVRVSSPDLPGLFKNSMEAVSPMRYSAARASIRNIEGRAEFSFSLRPNPCYVTDR